MLAFAQLAFTDDDVKQNLTTPLRDRAWVGSGTRVMLQWSCAPPPGYPVMDAMHWLLWRLSIWVRRPVYLPNLRSGATWPSGRRCLPSTVISEPIWVQARTRKSPVLTRTLSLVAVCYCRRRAAALRTVRHRLPSGSGESPPQGVLLGMAFRQRSRGHPHFRDSARRRGERRRCSAPSVS